MSYRKVFLGLALLVLLGISPSPASAQTCDECLQLIGGDWSVLDQLDFNGNGFTTFDLVIIRRLQINSGLNVITINNLTGLAVGGVDVTGDGVYTTSGSLSDFAIVQKLVFFLAGAGVSQIDLDDLINCGRMYILGICS